jgi:hypothetical protein
MSAKISLDHGTRWPFDSPEDWDGSTPLPEPIDWARRAALGVLANLGDRRGIKHELQEIDHDIRVEVVETLAEIIRLAHGGNSADMATLRTLLDAAADAAGIAYFRYTFGSEPEPGWLDASRTAFREAIRAAIATTQEPL